MAETRDNGYVHDRLLKKKKKKNVRVLFAENKVRFARAEVTTMMKTTLAASEGEYVGQYKS